MAENLVNCWGKNPTFEAHIVYLKSSSNWYYHRRKMNKSGGKVISFFTLLAVFQSKFLKDLKFSAFHIYHTVLRYFQCFIGFNKTC